MPAPREHPLYRPEGCHTVTPHLIVDGADRALDFYRAAFGAEVLKRLEAPDGKLMHAEFRIHDSTLMLADDFPEFGNPRNAKALGGTPITLHIWTPDVDRAVQTASEAGAEVTMAPQDMFWGDRYATIRDPFGLVWSFGQRKETPSSEEVEERAARAFAEEGPAPAVSERPGTGGPAESRARRDEPAPRPHGADRASKS